MHDSSYCGVNCDACTVRTASKSSDSAVKQQVVDQWSQLYKRAFTTDDMVCDGCKAGGSLFSLCTLCDIKDCCKRRGITSCKDCESFPCERLKQFYEYQEKNKDVLYS